MKSRISLVCLFISVHTLQSDNVKKNFILSFIHFMSDTEMSHQTYCSYTPQQNEVAECKNYHLLKVTQTLLIDMNVLKHFQGDAVLTTCCLINCMSSIILDDHIPYSIRTIRRFHVLFRKTHHLYMSIWILCFRDMDMCILDVPNPLPLCHLSLYL